MSENEYEKTDFDESLTNFRKLKSQTVILFLVIIYYWIIPICNCNFSLFQKPHLYKYEVLIHDFFLFFALKYFTFFLLAWYENHKKNFTGCFIFWPYFLLILLLKIIINK